MRLTALISTFIALAGLCLAESDLPYYTIDLDSQNVRTDHVIAPQFAGNMPFIASRHWRDESPVSMSANWTMWFKAGYGQYDTNGMVYIPGTWSTTNVCYFLGATNAWFETGEWYFSIYGIHTTGYTKTFGTGTMTIEYDPAADTALLAVLEGINTDWLTNSVGTQVEANRLGIITNVAGIAANAAYFVAYTNAQGVTVTNATLAEATSNSVALTGRILEFTIDTTDSNAVIVAGTGGITMSAVTNGAVVTYTINSGAGTFTNAVIEGADYTNTFIMAAGTNTAIRLTSGTNFIDQSIDEDVNMGSQDLTYLGTSNVTISSGSYGGVEGFKITSGTNNYWLLLQEATGDTFSSLTIEGVEYTTEAIINAGSNITIRTSGGAAFIDGVAAETTFGTVTNLNIEGSNYTANAILYAGSNVTIRAEGGTNFIDGVAAETTFGTVTGIDIEGSNYTTIAILYAGSNTTMRLEGGTNFIDTSAGTIDHGALTGLADNDHPQYQTTNSYLDELSIGNGGSVTNVDALTIGGELPSAFQDYSANLDALTANNGGSLTNVDALTLGGESASAFQDADAALDALALDDGNALTNLNLSVYVNATNSATFQWWSTSNRFAVVQIIGTTTNVTFVSP